jgi:hypothetical protein
MFSKTMCKEITMYGPQRDIACVVNGEVTLGSCFELPYFFYDGLCDEITIWIRNLVDKNLYIILEDVS